MQRCDSRCPWCARHFFQWLKMRMHDMSRERDPDEKRSGSGTFAEAAITSIGADSSKRFQGEAPGD